MIFCRSHSSFKRCEKGNFHHPNSQLICLLLCHVDEAGDGRNRASCYLFQAIKPEAMAAGTFASRSEQDANVQAVIKDILGHGNDGAILPGWFEHQAYLKSQTEGGLLFTEAEIREFAEVFDEAGVKGFDPNALRKLKG